MFEKIYPPSLYYIFQDKSLLLLLLCIIPIEICWLYIFMKHKYYLYTLATSVSCNEGQ